MEYIDMFQQLLKLIENKTLIAATVSQPRSKTDEVKRVKMKPVELKGIYHVQLEYQYERVLKHENIELSNLAPKLEELLQQFRQVQAEFEEQKIHIQLSKKFKVLWKSDQVQTKKVVNLSHNRKKNYLLNEDTAYPFLVRLGVQTPDGKVKKQKHDKFRQINRFVEFIDDALEYLPKDRPVRILDFGSGKSYLTFALYLLN
jgi:hypothetical protein